MQEDSQLIKNNISKVNSFNSLYYHFQTLNEEEGYSSR